VINFLQFLIQLPLYWLFGIVVAGEVHPQPQLLLFGKAGNAHFLLVGPTTNCGTATGLQEAAKVLLLVLSKLMNSGACSTVHKFTSMNNVAWLHCSCRTGPAQSYALNLVRPNKIKKKLLLIVFYLKN